MKLNTLYPRHGQSWRAIGTSSPGARRPTALAVADRTGQDQFNAGTQRKLGHTPQNCMPAEQRSPRPDTPQKHATNLAGIAPSLSEPRDFHCLQIATPLPGTLAGRVCRREKHSILKPPLIYAGGVARPCDYRRSLLVCSSLPLPLPSLLLPPHPASQS